MNHQEESRKRALDAITNIRVAFENAKTFGGREAQLWRETIEVIKLTAEEALEEIDSPDEAREDGLRAAEGRGLPIETVS